MTGRRGALLIALAALPGCTVLHPPAATAPVAPVAAAPAPVAQRGEPPGLLEFVTHAAAGQSRVFDDPASGPVRVTAGREYYSAATLFCRHFIVAPLGREAARRSETRAVCREGEVWQLDPIGTTGALRFGP